ncbi:hypothetical protein N7495_001283 [Penicillium taxi]|uniref:uncharacterized protein n=1 Tax=Penicillium taxi TaxID=168475 RepID=UPI00254544B9|nr:uncharacterized protein N7495_001283 [Penicillium taxi]KAJ5908601.1 hypothetical protein N7495_001283 [Penicillium taxi]
MQDIRLNAALVACFTLFPAFTAAFWRLPCRGTAGLARLDPLVSPGQISSHVHSIHGAGNFGMNSDMASLRESSCTSCAVTQDNSAYWTPALYFMHTNGSAEVVEAVGGMLAYYLLYGDNITAFPDNFRMLAGDPFQRNFTYPIPDPPKSDWTGDQLTQAALRQKAIGFNCLNYEETAEGSLYRHFMPNKTFLDEQCTDGLRLELMFPSCWNGKDVDSTDHKSHVAYPDLVMTGDCPEGYETRLVSLFFETIWDTYAFKDVDGYFTLANGDPTGFGYHGDFMYGWEDGVLQDAVDSCTSDTGLVEDCEIFDIQSQTDETQCTIDLPAGIRHENTYMHADGLPGNMPIEWGPGYAMQADMSISTTAAAVVSLSVSFHIDQQVATTTESTSTSTTPTPTPVASTYLDTITEEIIFIEKEIILMYDDESGIPYATETGGLNAVSSTTTTFTETATTISYVERDNVADEKIGTINNHARRHARSLHHRRDKY